MTLNVINRNTIFRATINYKLSRKCKRKSIRIKEINIDQEVVIVE